jgi:hypothetical protein
MKLSRQLKLIKSPGYQPYELVKNCRRFGNMSVPIIRRLHQSFRRGFLLFLLLPCKWKHYVLRERDISIFRVELQVARLHDVILNSFI